MLIQSGTPQCSLGTSSVKQEKKKLARKSESKNKGERTVLTLGFGDRLSLTLEFFGEGLVIEEDVGIVEFVVPSALEILHGVNQVAEFLIPHKGDDGGIGASGLFAIGGVIVIFGSP